MWLRTIAVIDVYYKLWWGHCQQHLRTLVKASHTVCCLVELFRNGAKPQMILVSGIRLTFSSCKLISKWRFQDIKRCTLILFHYSFDFVNPKPCSTIFRFDSHWYQFSVDETFLSLLPPAPPFQGPLFCKVLDTEGFAQCFKGGE